MAMSPAVREAIESAVSTDPEHFTSDYKHKRPRFTFENVRAILLRVIEDLPSGMTLMDLYDELIVGNNQTTKRG